MEGNWTVCNNLTKYNCLKCESFIYGITVECSVLTSEEYLEQKVCSSVALCKECDGKETYGFL